jgi:recombination protein RecT
MSTALTIQNATPAQIVAMTKDSFVKAGVSEEQFNKEAGFAIQAFRQNDYLAKMDKQSIKDAIVNVALTGLTLNPELKLGYLIPFKGRLYFRSSYMGKREILLRSGMVRDVWSELVYEKDDFSVLNGTTRELKHELPENPFEDRGKLVGGYWVAILQNGERPFGIMSKKEIDDISKRSESMKSGNLSPWKTDYEEMAKKTILNRAFKSLPKTGISDDCLRSMEADGQLDQEEQQDWIKRNTTPSNDLIEEDGPEDAVIVPDEPVSDNNGNNV